MTLIDHLMAALARPAPANLLPGDLVDDDQYPAKPAAVLIAITNRQQPGVILTVRREHLRAHAGQIAFPGGRLDPGEDAISAARREAYEELALDPSAVEVAGILEPYRTITGYMVTPVVGVIPPGLPLEPHDAEVADWFEAPLAHLIDPASQHLRSALFQGVERHYYEIEWKGRKIWGATAAMLVNLSRRLSREVWS